MKRYLFLGYGVVAYIIFFVTILYAIGFTGNLVVPKTIDSIPQVSPMAAIVTDIALLLLPAFRRRWMKYVPLPVERSTSVFSAGICLALMMWLWQPIAGTIWMVNGLAGKGLMQFFFFLGWGLVFISTMLVNHFELFGLRQVWLYYHDRPYEQLCIRTPMFYRFVRNPLYLGFVLAFWCTPLMTASHLLFAIFCTTYILSAIQFENRKVITAVL